MNTVVQLNDYKKDSKVKSMTDAKCEVILEKQRKAQERAYAKRVKADLTKGYMALLSR